MKLRYIKKNCSSKAKSGFRCLVAASLDTKDNRLRYASLKVGFSVTLFASAPAPDLCSACFFWYFYTSRNHSFNCSLVRTLILKTLAAFFSQKIIVIYGNDCNICDNFSEKFLTNLSIS